MTIKSFFQKIFSPIVVGKCLGMVVVTALLIFGTLQFLQCYTDHGEAVVVPNIRGMKTDVAESKMKALGLRLEVKDTGYVDSYVGNVVLEQSLHPGQRVKAGRVVFVTVNASAPRAIVLPDVAGNTSRRQAESRLRAMGFTDIRIETIEGDKDWVYSMKVNGHTAKSGERAPITAVLTLVVGNGVVEEEYNGSDSLDYGFWDEEPLTGFDEENFE